MSDKIRIDQLADTIMKGLTEYADLAADDLKEAVKFAADTAKTQIKNTAPKDTGAYAKSWTSTKQSETANTISYVVHSRNRYQLTHLLEYGHAKRGGGRVSAQPHIAPAEESAIEKLEQEIEKALGG